MRDQLASGQRGALTASPALDSVQGRVLSMVWSGFDLHPNDRVWPERRSRRRDAEATIEIHVEPRALEFVVP